MPMCRFIDGIAYASTNIVTYLIPKLSTRTTLESSHDIMEALFSLLSFARVPTTFTCSICLDTKHEHNPKLIQEDAVCADCVTESIIPQFHTALKYESKWPVRWGEAVLEAEHFQRELGKDFIRGYERRVKEYSCPWRWRVHCQNLVVVNKQTGKYARPWFGRKIALTPTQTDAARKKGKMVVECGVMVATIDRRSKEPSCASVTCWSCRGGACSTCGESVPSKSPPHKCGPRNVDVQITAEDLESKGQVRGEDFQVCPVEDCGTLVTLSSGCNHVSCPSKICPASRTGFCYVCGALVAKNSRHWARLLGMPCPFISPSRERGRRELFADLRSMRWGL